MQTLDLADRDSGVELGNQIDQVGHRAQAERPAEAAKMIINFAV